MRYLEKLEPGKRTLYSESYFSGEYSHEIYLKKAIDDASNKPKFYISIFSNINGTPTLQGYLYFYLDYETMTSSFIGINVLPEYRNLNIASLLISCWIDLCINNGYDFLKTNKKQRKPFLLYLLKTYGFEVYDTSLYEKRDDVISICRSTNPNDTSKILLFKDSKHEKNFIGTNVYKNDNYKIVHEKNDIILLDKVILPLQSMKRNQIDYELLNQDLAEIKTEVTLSRHKK